MIKGVVFDMDGLMFDSERLINMGWHYACEQAGFSISDDVILKTLGIDLENTKRVFLEELGSDLDYDSLDRVRVEFMKQYLEEKGVPYKPGLFELLDYLKANGYKMTVATSTAGDQAAHLLEKAGVLSYFGKIVCGDDIVHGKPEPDIYLQACRNIGFLPEECMALEDSPMGILAAYRAGMRPVMIPDLIRPEKPTKKLLYALLNDLTEVIELLKKENGEGALIDV